MMRIFSRLASIAQGGQHSPRRGPGQAKLNWARSRPRIQPSAPAPGARGCPPPSCCTRSTDFHCWYSSQCFWPRSYARCLRFWPGLHARGGFVVVNSVTVLLLVNQARAARLAALNLSASQRTSHVHSAGCLPCWKLAAAPKQKQQESSRPSQTYQ